ncbi:tRNA (adenosine(37)-N6)-threonylcarbamoyltransferase complex ATPase subunit type 1 TsaE [Planctomycetota bacterium]
MNSENNSESPEMTLSFGMEIGRSLGYGRIIALESELGGGKTVLAKGIAVGLGIDDIDAVTSPTFTLVNRYKTTEGDICHVDLYRLNSAQEAVNIGFEEIIASGCTVIVEWAERARELFPEETVWIHIKVLGPQKRRLTINCPSMT